MISSPPFFPLMNPFYWYLFTSLAAEFFLCMNGGASVVLAWKNSLHFTTPSLVLFPAKWGLRNDWWHITTQIWVVLLIGCRCRVESSLQPIRSTLDSNLSSVWNFFSRFSDVFLRVINVSVANVGCFFMVPLTHFLPHFLVEPQLSLSRENNEDERFCPAFTVV